MQVLTVAAVIVASGVGCALDDTPRSSATAGASGSGTSGISGTSGAAGFADPVPEAICGDGVLHIYEQCDDGNTTNGDGCSAPGVGAGTAARGCRLEDGWDCKNQCDPVPQKTCNNSSVTCSRTTCGDGTVEGTESCDDKNVRPYDGCYNCKKEPCVRGVCTNACGDGILLPESNSTEECDDGNLRNGDGCGDDCKLEPGHTCHIVTDALPEVLKLPAIWRDFINVDNGGHPDFNMANYRDHCLGMTQLNLATDGAPTSSGKVITVTADSCPASQTSFYSWYRKTSGSSGGSDNLEVLGTMDLNASGTEGTYVKSDGNYFPIDGQGWIANGKETASYGHNFGFTTEVRYWFVYNGDEVLDFTGDDDLFVFVNGRLCVDLGGLHPPANAIMNFANPSADSKQAALVQSCKDKLVVGNLYEMTIFGAERHLSASTFSLKLEGFVTGSTDCSPFCGDGEVTAPEQCDDGRNNGTVNSRCNVNCRIRVD